MLTPTHTRDADPSGTATAPLGRVDTFEGGIVLGWAAPAQPGAGHLTVELVVDGAVVDSACADRFRGDLRSAGVGDGYYGFVLQVPAACFDDRPHHATVRDAASGVTLDGCPYDLVLGADELALQAARRTAVPEVRGSIDKWTTEGVFGWAASMHDCAEPLVVEWRVDGERLGVMRAGLFRADLLGAGVAHGHFGFVIEWPDAVFDGREHELAVSVQGSDEQLPGSPVRILLTPVQLWEKSAGDDDPRRRQLADRALAYCEARSDDQLDENLHADMLRLHAWLRTQTAGRLARRVQAQLDRLTAFRCVLTLNGMLGYREIAGTIAHAGASAQPLGLELLEGDGVVARVEMSADAFDGDLPQRFVFTLPETLLDDQVHRLGVRVQPFGGVLGPWSYLLTVPRGDQEMLAAAADPVWDTVPAAAAAQLRRKKVGKPSTAVALARAALAEALVEAEDAEAEVETAPGAGRDEGERGIVETAVLRARCRLGEALRTAGEWAGAAAEFSAAVDLDTEHLGALTGLVRSLLDAGDEAGAAAVLANALERLPDAGTLHALADDVQGRRRVHGVRTLAFYLPQFHPTAENNEWWGEGFTEWHNVGSAAPLFHGHLQPRRPTALGYYDLRLAEAANAQFDLARRYGIDGFCYYYYWFDGRRVLNRPLDDLAAGRSGPFPFCVCWANEDWTRAWDGSTGEVLLAQNHSPDSDFRFIQDLAPLLRHANYIRVHDKPMVLVYRANKLARPRETISRWREWCRREGVGELYVCAVQAFGFTDPRPLGFDAAVEFPPHQPPQTPTSVYREEIKDIPSLVNGFRGNVYSYQAFARTAIRRPREPYTLHRTAMVAWDNTARRGKDADIFHWFSVETFERWMLANGRRAALEQADAVCFVNAWNEWAEGSVMEPDAHFGHEVLAATRRAKRIVNFDPSGSYWRSGCPLFPPRSLEDRERDRVLLVGHDAHPSGAQTNLLNMARTLKRQLGVDVYLMLVEGGELLTDYERVGPTFIIGRDEHWRLTLQAELRRLREVGVRRAICNTVVTGDAVEVLKQEGFRVVGLVHEMPALIESYGLQAQCWRFADKADNIVCASAIVADEFTSRYWPDPRKMMIAPQGITFNRYHDSREELRQQVREELKLPERCEIVIGCGYGDTRKGADLFVQMAGDVSRQRDPGSIAFVWIGALEPTLRPYLMSDIERLGLGDCFRITGRTPDAAKYFIAAEVFALTSREDPFPSVVMEAMDASLPVVAFEGGGGYVDIVGSDTGALVPYLDVSAMVDAVLGYLGDVERRAQVGAANHALSRARFGYPPYMRKLLALMDGVPASNVAAGLLQAAAWPGDSPRPTISVIVPNYNYARYLELRLRTIIEQTLQPDEIIVLDDASTDSSLAIIHEVGRQSPIPIQVITSETNTGNPFAQWAKGLERATGDLVWIAEADDYCEPTLLETLARELVDLNVVMAWTDSVMVDDQGQSRGFQYKDHYSRSYGAKWHQNFRMPGAALAKDCLLAENVIPNASAVLFRRVAAGVDFSLMRQHSFSGDWWFWLTLARAGDLVYRAEALNYHRRHNASVMGAVLKNGPRLVHETLEFYRRVLDVMPELLTPASSASVLLRLKQLYALFPELESVAPRLDAHPDYMERFGTIATALITAAQSRPAAQAGETTVVLSDDALTTDQGALAVLRHCLAIGPVQVVVLLTGQDSTQQGLAACRALAARMTLINVDSMAAAAGESGDDASVQHFIAPGAIDSTLRQVLDEFGSPQLMSHGLLAHAAVGATTPQAAPAHWTLVAGSDFSALLGQPPRLPQVTIERLGTAIARCTKAAFVGDVPPHAFARMAASRSVPVEKLVLLNRTLAEKPRPDPDKPIRFVALGTWGTAAQWQAVSATLRRLFAAFAKRMQLRLLVWRLPLEQLRSELGDEPNVELVELYARPKSLSNIGDIAILPLGGSVAQSSAKIEFEQAGLTTCTIDMLLDARHDPRLLADLKRRFPADARKDMIMQRVADPT